MNERPIFEFGTGGVRATIFVGIDPINAFMLAMAIFLGITLALAVYAKALK